MEWVGHKGRKSLKYKSLLGYAGLTFEQGTADPHTYVCHYPGPGPAVPGVFVAVVLDGQNGWRQSRQSGFDALDLFLFRHRFML